MTNKINFAKLLFVLILCSTALTMANQTGNEDAHYLNIKYEFTLNPDGSMTYNYTHSLKLFSSFAFTRHFGESFIVYNPKWQTLKINKSVTTMADGKKVESPYNAFNEVLPRFAAGAGPYLNIREMVVTHTGLESNSIIDFDYTINTKNGMFPGLLGKVVIGDRSPIDNMTIIVKVPKGKELHYYCANGNFKPEITNDDKNDIYTWVFQNLDLVEVENGQPSLEEIVPVLYLGTATSEQIINHILAQGDDLYKLSAEAKSLVNEVTKDKTTSIEKAQALQNYVNQNVGYMNGDLYYTGFNPLNADEVYKRNVGSQLDKAILLTAMLKSINIDAVPVLASNNSSISNIISLLSEFENALVMCKGLSPDGGNLFLDPIAKQNDLIPHRIIHQIYLPLEKNSKVEECDPSTLKDNYLVMDGEFVLDKEGNLTGNITVERGGAFSNFGSVEDINSAFTKKMKTYGFEISDPSESTFNMGKLAYKNKAVIHKKLQLNTSTGYYELPLPEAPGGLSEMNIQINKSNRTTPYVLPEAFIEKYNYSFTLPENLSLAGNPGVVVKNDLGELFSIISVDNGKVNVKREIKFNVDRISPDKYDQFYELMAGWRDKYHNKLYIK